MSHDALVLYFDTSALIKRYADERGSRCVETLFAKAPIIVTATLTYAEVYAALYRLRRDGLLEKRQLERLIRDFESDWKQFVRVDYTVDVQRLGVALIARHPLRGADLVHLSSAVAMANAGLSLRFVASDLRLLNAATEASLRILDPVEDKL